jgi:aspartyl/asparaginyl beta-hydroxylase (cupin superfamily)
MEKATIKLPLQFDTEKLKADINQFAESDWILHYNKRDYDGDWHIIALKAVEGNKYKIFSPFEVDEPTLYTEHMAKCPYIKEVLDTLQCETTTVRLMRLKSGARIKEHTDYNLSLDDKELRLHIPITTNSKMEFYLDKQRIILNEGECWYLNFNLIHSLYNGGDEPRVHLVIDCEVNDWLLNILN